jgi:hypothetical protein
LPASIAYPAENPLSKRIQRLLDGGEHQERFLARCLDCPGRAILLSYGDINGLNIEQLISGFVRDAEFIENSNGSHAGLARKAGCSQRRSIGFLYAPRGMTDGDQFVIIHFVRSDVTASVC